MPSLQDFQESEHTFVGVNALVFVLLVCTCLFVGYILKKYRMHFLPDSSAAMLLGFLVGAFIYIFGSREGFGQLLGHDAKCKFLNQLRSK